MGLFDSSTKTTTATELTPQQNTLMNAVIPFAAQYHATDTRVPTSQQLVTPFNAQQVGAQTEALTAAGGPVQGLANAGADSQSFLMNKAILDPASNPYLNKTIDAAVRPITQSLTEQELPQLRSGAAGAGQYGSSRQGIAEGEAAGRASQAIGDTSAKVANANYQAGLDAMTKSLGLLPQTQQAQLAPSTIAGSVGDAQQALDQQTQNANLARYMYNVNQPLSKAQNTAALAAGLPGGGTSSTASGNTGLLQGLVGGASLGNSLFPGVVGTAAGGGIGALLSLFG